MKHYLIRFLCCMLLLLSVSVQSQKEENTPKGSNISAKPDKNIQPTKTFDISNLKLPKFKGEQSIKGLITIIPYGSENALTRTDKGLVFEKFNETQYKESQLWWVVQDYIFNSFALVDVKNGSKWLAIERDSISKKHRLILTENISEEPIKSLLNIEYIDDKYFFEFQKPNSVTTEGATLLRSYQDKEIYFKVNNKANTTVENWALQADSIRSNFVANDYIFTYKKIKSFEGDYIGIPIYNSSLHTITRDGNSKTTIANAQKYSIENNKAILASGDIITINNDGDSKMFKVTFNKGAVAEIGLLNNLYSKYGKKILQGEGARKALAGIGMDEGGIYLFNKGRKDYVSRIEINHESGKKEVRNLQPGIPIYFGYTQGKLIAKQGENIKPFTLTGVPTPVLLGNKSSRQGRLLIKVREGSIDISYKPKAILITDNFGKNNTTSDLYSTDPSFSFVPKNSITKPNIFDWRSETYWLKEKKNNKIVKEYVKSPFYSDKPNMSSIAYKNTPSGEYLGGEDFSSSDGWELVKSYFTDENEAAVKENQLTVPYMILYNRYTGKLRVFTYIKNVSIAHHLEIKLISSHSKISAYQGKYARPKIWATVLQGLALDDEKLTIPKYSRIYKALESNEDNRFYYADFMLNYDPCVCFFESDLQVIISKTTKGDIKLTGRTIGGVIPQGSPAAKEAIFGDPNKYLTGVLDGTADENTLGDISFKSFNAWNQQEWSNKTSISIPGRKVQQWERDMIKHRWAGVATMAFGDFTSASGKALKALAALKPGAVSFWSPDVAKGVGEVVDAAGTAIKGMGRAAFAHSFKIQLDNLKDEPDKHIPLVFPPPQPSVVFSELAAKGTVKIETLISNDIYITTPGSLNAEAAPEEYKNASKGARPVYNAPLGVFTLLHKPSVAINIKRDKKGNVTGSLHLKEQPYISLNAEEDSSTSFTASFVMTLYTKEKGFTIISRPVKQLQLIRSKNPLKKEIDITEAIEDMVYYSSISKNSDIYKKSDTEEEVFDLIKEGKITVDLMIDYSKSTGKTLTGRDGASILKQTFRAKVKVFADDEMKDDEKKDDEKKDDEKKDDEKKDDITLQDYQASNRGDWGDNYIVTRKTSGYEETMRKYCLLTNDFIEPRSFNRAAKKTKEVLKTSKVVAQKTADLRKDIHVEEASINVYPNPSSQIFNVRYVAKAKGKINIRVTDMAGRVILTHKDVASNINEQKQATINLQTLVGVYILKIKFANGESLETKLIKK